jgi:tRNA A58 N-methylase Trm61
MEVFIGMMALIAGLEIGNNIESTKCEDTINQVKMTMVLPTCTPTTKTVYPSDIGYIVDLKKNQVMVLDKETTEKVLGLKIGKSK